MDEKALFKETRDSMEKAVKHLIHEFNKIKTGRASLALLEDIRVEYYGAKLPLNQVATLSIPESRTITIQPWDVKALSLIERAILQSDLGLTPVNDGKMIRLNIPPLTEERRRELVKMAGKMAEEARIAIRNVRRHTNEKLKKMEKGKEISEDEFHRLHGKVQEITDEYIEKVDRLLKAKEEEIMEV